ncbi:MAG: hypothetical protein V3R83_08080, partial [Gammaproteobacteria bacterium]
MSNPTAKQITGPIEPERRLDAVDMVRGFALFGVLLVNMYNFGASDPLNWGAPIDELAFSVKRFFFETKSWRLFAFLFGFGFALQMLRAEQRGANFLPFYLRRLAVLFVIGMGHSLLYGGILMVYAELGLILVLFRKVPPNVLLVASAILIMAFPIERAVTSLLEGPQDISSLEVRL